jgi:transcriptional regulator GlxA family with amidase domain
VGCGFILTAKPLELIAEDCGFASASHLSGAFKYERGIAPGKFRKDAAEHRAPESSQALHVK